VPCLLELVSHALESHARDAEIEVCMWVWILSHSEPIPNISRPTCPKLEVIWKLAGKGWDLKEL
jgi:hypothetical protein